MQKIFSKISNYLEAKSSTAAYFSDKRYVSIKFSDSYFHDILLDNTNHGDFVTDLAKECAIAFIDGGNIEIAGNNNFSFQLMRIYSAIYKDKKRIKSNLQNYFVLIDTIDSNDDNGTKVMAYRVEVYQDDKLKDEFIFKSIKNGEQLKPESALNLLRRLYEIKEAEIAADDLNQQDFIVIDGDLNSKDELEKKELEALYNKADAKNIIVLAVSKTSSKMTDSGQNLVSYISSISNSGKWYYYPICKNNNPEHKAEIFVAKLHDQSDYAFLIDIHSNANLTFKNSDKEFNDFIENCISKSACVLAEYSKDPVFFGYPYGLIEADINARVQENERQFLQMRFMQSFKNKQFIKKLINSNKAHDVLDSIR
ncbi:MAG: DNA double-strand break repair nuclease NurA [Candidatus Woesearchaeota archaeon]